MKKYTAWVLSLLFYISVLPWHQAGADGWKVNLDDNTVLMEHLKTGNPSEATTSAGGHAGHYISTQIVSPFAVDVRDYAAALTHVPIQAALSAIDNAIGAEVFIPRGTYEIGTGLLLQDKNNVTIRGAGKDITILKMDLQNASRPTVYNGDLTWGILSIECNAGLNAPVSNITIRDMTFWLYNEGTNGGVADYGTGLERVKNVYFRGVNNITFENIKIRGSRWEALYVDGNASAPSSRITVKNSTFQDTQFDGFNVNTGDASRIIVDSSIFDNCIWPIQITAGHHVEVTNNIIVNSTSGITVGEAYYTNPTNELDSILISGNVITGMGRYSTTEASMAGITVRAGNSAWADNSVDIGIVVSNNVVHNSIKNIGNTGSIHAFEVIGGNVKMSNNHVTGATVEAGSTGDLVAYSLGGSVADSGARRQQVYFNNNTLDNVINIASPWDYGILIAGKDNSVFHLSGNIISAVKTAYYALRVIPTSGTPIVHLNGDILNGYIQYGPPGNWEDGGNAMNGSYILNDTPLFGSSNGALGSIYTRDAVKRTFTDNDTTPSVLRGNIWQTANTGATSITAFTEQVDGQEISITFTDNVTTVVNVGDIHLAGATNFVATPYDVLRLIWAKDVGWVEVSRSVN